MEYIFSEWQKKLSEFESSVKKDLEEIRKCKAEMQQMQLEVTSQKKGKYISDDQRLILSAPEIIIGYVDEGGAHYEGQGSNIIIRGTQVDLQGVGLGGQVATRAASILQIAEDPGSDGHEKVVYPHSQVVSQARNISIQSNDAEGVFSESPRMAGGSGISIHADEHLVISASQSSKEHEERLTTLLSLLKDRNGELETEAQQHKLSFGMMIASMEKLLEEKKLLQVDDMLVRSSYHAIRDLNEKIELLSLQLSEEVRSYADVLSLLAETNRQLNCLNKEKEGIKKDDDFKTQLTGASISIDAERISMTSIDGDGNLRDNDSAGVSILANNIAVSAIEADGSLKKDGKLSINTKTVEISTANNQDIKYEDGELTSGNYPAEGDVIIRSKNISLESIDYEIADKEEKAKALTKEGSITIRAEKALLSATDIEEEAPNIFSLDATEKTIQMQAEKMMVGEKDKSKLFEVTSETINITAEKTLKSQQGDGKALLQAEGDKISIKGEEVGIEGKTKIKGDTDIDGKTHMSDSATIDSDATIKGDTTINGNATAQGEVKGQKGSFDNLEAKLSFKSRNISD